MRFPIRAAVLLSTLGWLAASAAPAGASVSPPSADDHSRVDTYIRDSMSITGTPGLAYAIVGPDGIEHTSTWGHDGAGEPITENTPFLWGSVAKPVTATAVLALVEAGELDLDEPVRTYLPEFTLADEDAAARVTIRHLLTQTSGIPEGTGITDRFDAPADPYASAVADLAGVAPLHEPGAEHEYTSANYLVLGAVVEAVTGRPYAGYLRDSILDPLEMSGAVTGPEHLAGLPPGHRIVFGHPVAFATPYDPTGPSYGGYLGGSVVDLAHFAMLHLDAGQFGQNRILSPETVELAHTGTAPVHDVHTYGLGWRDDDRNADLGTRTIWHGGAAHGYHAMIALLPERDRAVIVLQNVYGVLHDSQIAVVGLHAARVLAGGDAPEPPGTPGYPWLLAGLSTVLALLLGGIGWSVRCLLRPGSRIRSRSRIVATTIAWVAGCAALAHGAGVAVPAAAGGRLRDALLFVPDVGWLLATIACGAVTLAVLGLAVGARRLLGRRGPRPLSPG